MRFRTAAAPTSDTVSVIAEQVPVRALRCSAGSGLIECDDVREMRAPRSPRPNSGFSLDATVCVAALDRAGLKPLPRHRTRPPFALERLERSRS